jgi:hypothetical protein
MVGGKKIRFELIELGVFAVGDVLEADIRFKWGFGFV